MIHARPLLLLPLLALPLATPREKPGFSPEEGSVVVKSFEDSTDFDLTDMSLVANGQDVGAMMGDIDLNVTTATKITVTDSYESLGGGRPLRLVRTFDELGTEVSMTFAAEMAGDTQSDSSEGKSALEGMSVVFEWDPDAEEYDVSFEGSEGDEELLEGLEENMDLRFLLPPGEVSEGDAWEVELSELGPLLATGGDLKIQGEDEGENDVPPELEELFNGGFLSQLTDSVSGTCTCTYVGVVDDNLAEIQVDIEASGTMDLSEMFSGIVDALGEDSGMGEVSVDSADLAVDLTSSGTLLWSLEAGRLHSFEATGTVDLGLDISVFASGPGGEEMSFEASLELSGSISKSADVEE